MTILEQVQTFFQVYQTGSLDASNLNLDKTCAVQQESTFDLCRQHLIEIALHMANHPVLSQFDELIAMIDAQMPFMASLIRLPGLILIFRHENCGPNRAMQLLDPQCKVNFDKQTVLMAKRLLETGIDKW